MVVIPAGHFVMGSEVGEQDRGHDEGPTRQVVVGKPFAASKFDITFDQWEACADHGPCAQQIRDYGWGRKRQPVISVSWNDAKTYVSWLSEQTGGKYRLLTEAEWEYLARLGNSEPFDLAKFAGSGMANCDGCGSKWDSLKPAPVGSFPANALGLFDLQGNVWQWLEDCWTDGYDGAPSDASAVERADCKRRVLRGGAWNYELNGIRPAFRYAKSPLIRDSSYGFRVARDLL